MSDQMGTEKAPITIKKYANRRLYNTATSSYVTLGSLAQMVKDGQDFGVHDAKTGEDITRSVLTQIIFEEEGKGQNLLPISFLRQLIRFYDDSLRSLVPGYLEMSMDSFSKNQEELKKYMASTFGDLFPLRQFEEMGRQNFSMFQNAIKMFTPTLPLGNDSQGMSVVGESKDTEAATSDNDLSELKAQVEGLQRQLNAMTQKKMN